MQQRKSRVLLFEEKAQSLIAGWASREHRVGVVAVLKVRAAELDEATRAAIRDAITRRDWSMTSGCTSL